MSIWKNIKCPVCGKPNERDVVKKRNGSCVFCGFKFASNLNSFTNMSNSNVNKPTKILKNI